MEYYNRYADIKKLKPEGIRNKLRSLALDGLSIIDRLGSIEKQLSKPRIQFLYIHHVFSDEEKKLDALMKQLSKNHHFISYSEAVEKILTGTIDKPYISISSDDGFKNNIGAAEILNTYGAKACFFINPSMIGVDSYTAVERHCKNRLNLPPVAFMNWQDIEWLLKCGHEIGSHTMEHINVATTDTEVFRDDCRQTYEILKARCGEAKHFAYPYGRFFHFNEAARKVVFETGFESCATAERGCHINPDSELSKTDLFIRRDHVLLDWKAEHIEHFITNNARKATASTNTYSYKA